MKKFFITLTYLFCIIVVLEIATSFTSFHYLIPVKNAQSYGYISKIDGSTIIPLNKYPSRRLSQLALPYEIIIASYYNNKDLSKAYNEETKLYGYKDKNNNIVIDYQFTEAQDFKKSSAIVAINVNNSKKYGTISKSGDWIILPKYEYICDFNQYYTKACIDKDHCGMIDRYGLEIVTMSYKTEKICDNSSCISKICTIGKHCKKPIIL